MSTEKTSLAETL